MHESTQTQLHANQRMALHTNDWAQKQSSVFAQYIDSRHSVLEYGCGDGCILETLDADTKAGIELNPGAAAIAIEKGLNIRTSAADFNNNAFDRIIVSYEAKQLRDPVHELSGLRPLLSDSGLLLLSQPIDARGQSQRPSIQHLEVILVQAGYEVENIAIKRHSYRSTGFQFQANESISADLRKTYWMVKPFISLVAVARKAA